MAKLKPRHRSGLLVHEQIRDDGPGHFSNSEVIFSVHVAAVQLRGYLPRKPVKLAVDVPAAVHRDLLAYTEALARETGQSIADPSKVVAPMLARFMATDRAFAKAQRKNQIEGEG